MEGDAEKETVRSQEEHLQVILVAVERHTVDQELVVQLT